MKLKEKLKGKKFILVLLLLGIVCLIKFALKDTHAYYGNTQEIPFISGTIGDFSPKGDIPDTNLTSDFTTLIYLQNQRDTDVYNLVNYIPVKGYVYDSKRSKCSSTGTISMTEAIKITDGKIKYKVNAPGSKQVICRIYYNVDKTSDITVYALVQDNVYGTKEYNGNKYRFLKGMPTGSPTFQGYECTNKTATTTITYASQKLKTITNKPNTCYAYFILK